MKPNTSLSIGIQVQGGYKTFLNFLKLVPTCPDMVAQALRRSAVRTIRSVTSTTVTLFMSSSRSITDLSSTAFSWKNQTWSWLPSVPQLESLKYHKHMKMMMIHYMQTWIHSPFHAFFKCTYSMYCTNWIFERKVYRRILGPVYENEKENWRILTNKEIYARVKKPTITETVRLNGLRWFGHVQRMEENRIPQKGNYIWIWEQQDWEVD